MTFSGPHVLALFIVEWTHDDGMDQHQEVVAMTTDEADHVRRMLDERGALEPHVYEPSPIAFRDLVDNIEEDLPDDADLAAFDEGVRQGQKMAGGGRYSITIGGTE